MTRHHPTRALSWAPDTGTLLVSTIVGLLVFVGMLLYGPAPKQPPEPPPTVDVVRSWVRGNVISSISRGRDVQAINELLEHLQTDPGFGWGWRLVYQLASRDESLAEERQLAADRLAELTRGESYDAEWPWDRRTRGLIHMIAGRTAEARATLARGIERVKTDPGINPGNAAFLEAAMLAIGDQPDEALAALERAIEDERYLNSGWLRTTPDLDSLRDDPRLEALIERASELERRPTRRRFPEPDPEPDPDPGPDPEPEPDSGPDSGPGSGPGSGPDGAPDDPSGG